MAWQTLDQQYKEQNTQNDRSNYLKDIIAGLSIANNNDPMTLLGYALGRFGSNYVNRGLERRQQEKNTKGYDEWMQGVNKTAADAIPTVQGKAIPGQQNQNQQQLDILKGPSFVPEDVAREMTAGTPALQSAVNMQNAAPNTSPQISEIANQILGGQRQYAQNYDMTSDEVYNNAYRIARQNGSTETQARQFAQQKAAEYQPQRVNALSNAFIGKGVNPDGTINNQGVAMLAQLALEDPQQTNLLGNMYQTPQGATKYAQDIAKMMQNSDLSLRNTLRAQQQAAELREQAAQAGFGRSVAMLDVQQQKALDNLMMKAGILADATGQPMQSFIPSLLGFGGNGGSGRNSGGRSGGNSGDWSKESYKNYIDRKKDFLGAGESLEEGRHNPYANDLFMAALRYAGEMDTENAASMNFWKDYYMTTRGWTEDQFNQFVSEYAERSSARQETADKNRRLQVNGAHNRDRDSGATTTSTNEDEAEEANKAEDDYYNPDASDVDSALGLSEAADGGNEVNVPYREYSLQDIFPKHLKGRKNK